MFTCDYGYIYKKRIINHVIRIYTQAFFLWYSFDFFSRPYSLTYALFKLFTREREKKTIYSPLNLDGYKQVMMMMQAECRSEKNIPIS